MAWLDGYRYRRKVTIDNTKIDGTLTDFPVALLINSSAGLGAADLTAIFGSGRVVKDAWRKRIAVTTSDGATECPVEIELWDTANQTAVLHTKVPSISSSADTEIYLYYGATADNTSVGDSGEVAAQSVWDTNFVAVWHMNQDPSGGASSIKDSTSNNNDGTPAGSMTAGDLVDGQCGKAIDFDGTDDYINFGSDASLDDIEDLTIESVFNADDWGESGYGRIVQKASVNVGWSVYLLEDTSYTWRLLRDAATGLGIWESDTGLTADGTTWHYVAVSHDGGSLSNDAVMYVDGDSVTVTEIGTPTALPWDSEAGQDCWVGARNNSGPDREFDGKIGEVRITNGIRSAAWVKATYNTLFDTLVTWSAEEEHGWLNGYKFRRKITIDNTKIDGDLTDFPVTLLLDATAGTGNEDLSKIFTDIGKDSDRKKIAVTLADGQTECYVEIERWNTAASQAVLHTKVAAIDSAADTVIYFYWGTTSDNSTYVGDTGDAAAQNVWDSNFVAVYHMGSDPTGGSDSLKDATGDLDATPGNMEAADIISGHAGGSKAFSFDGSNEYAAAAVTGISGSAARTAELVAEVPTGFSDIGSALYFGDGMTNYAKYGLRWDHNGGADQGKFRCEFQGAAVMSAAAYDDDSWHHFVARNAAGENTHDTDLLIDGALDGSATTSGTDTTIATDNTTHGLQLARQYSSSTWYYATVKIAEVRLSDVERSTAWIKATYNSLFDTLVSWGDEERYTWLPGFSYRRKVTISSAKIDATLTDFPIALHFISSSGLGSDDLRRVFEENTAANRKKIAVTASDGLTQYFVEIEDWDSTNMRAAIHAKIPSISSSEDTELYFYFGGTADNTNYVGDTGDTPAQDAWDSYYVGVWHLAQDPSGGAGAVKDSTSNAQHMSSVGTMTSGDLVDFAGGLKGLDFDGSDDGVYVDAMPLSGFPFTMESLFKNSLGNTCGLGGIVDASTTNEFAAVYAATNLATANAYRTSSLQGSTSFGDGDVIHSVLSLTDDSNMVLYANGVSEDTTASSTPSWVAGYDRISIGSLYYSSPGYFVGIVGEFRISSVARSAAWVKATYNSLVDALVTWSEEEAFTWLGQYAYRRQILTDPSKVDSDLSDFPVMLPIGATVGTGSDDLTGILDISNESFTLDDDFTGLDGDGYSRQRWHFYNRDGATDTAVIASNALKMSWGGGAADDWGWYIHNTRYASDIDVEIDFNVDTGPATTNWYFRLHLVDFDNTGHNNRVFIGVGYFSGARYYQTNKLEDGSWTTQTLSATSDSAIKLRIVRSGSTITVYYDDSGWTQLAQYTSTDMGTLRPAIEYGSNTSWPACVVSLNSFTVNSGTADYIEGTRLGVTKADGTTKCYVEVERWETGDSEAMLHFKAPAIDSDYPTPFYLYYDCDIPDPDYVGLTGDIAAQNVWDSNFKAVWHLSQDPSKTDGVLDSTGNGYHLSGVNMEGTELTEGNIAESEGLFLDATNSEYLKRADADAFEFAVGTAFTVEAVFKSGSASDVDYLLTKQEDSGNYRGVLWYKTSGSPDALVLMLRDTQGSKAIARKGDTSIGTSWAYGAGTYDGGTAVTGIKLYANGDRETESTVYDVGTIADLSNAIDLNVSARNNSAAPCDDHYECENRVSFTERSAAWIKATYNTLFDTLISYGAEDEVNVGVQDVNVDLNAVQVQFGVGAASVTLAVPFFANAIGINFTPGAISVQEGNTMTGRHLYVTGRAITPFAEGEAKAPDVSGEGKPVIIGGE